MYSNNMNNNSSSPLPITTSINNNNQTYHHMVSETPHEIFSTSHHRGLQVNEKGYQQTQVWNVGQPYQSTNSTNQHSTLSRAGKSATAMLMSSHQDYRREQPHNRPNTAVHASLSERSPSQTNNYMHPNLNAQPHASSSPYHHHNNQPQCNSNEVAPSSSYSAFNRERNTSSGNGSAINSQLLHTNRGAHFNNFDIPSSNCQRAHDGKSFIQQADHNNHTKQELKTNQQQSRTNISTDTDLPNNNIRTNMSNNDRGGLYHMEESHSNGALNNRGRNYSNSSANTIEYNRFNNSPPPLHLAQSAYPSIREQQQHYQQSSSVPNIPPNTSTKRISPTVNYSHDESHGNRGATTIHEYNNIPQSDLHAFYKQPIHVQQTSSPTSTTYQYSSHHVHAQQQTPLKNAASDHQVQQQPTTSPNYPTPVQKERSVDISYSSNGYQPTNTTTTNTNNSGTIRSNSTNFTSADVSLNGGRNASNSGGSDDNNSDSKLNSESRKHKKKGPKKREISRDDMKKYFHVSQTIAAKMLGVSVSTLKRRFYEEFNMKWPYVPSKTNTSKRRKDDDGQHESDEHASSQEYYQQRIPANPYDSPYKKIKSDVAFDVASIAEQSPHGVPVMNRSRSTPPPFSGQTPQYSSSYPQQEQSPMHAYPHSYLNGGGHHNIDNGSSRHVKSENVSYVAPRLTQVVSYQHAEPYSPPSVRNTHSQSLMSYHSAPSSVNHPTNYTHHTKQSSPPGFMMRSEDVYSSNNLLSQHFMEPSTETYSSQPTPNLLPPISSFKMESWK